MSLRNMPSALPPRRDQQRFIVGNYGIYVATSLMPLLLPMIVIAHVGAGQNAYFAIVWQLITAVILLLTMLTGPYVAEASSGDTDLRHLTYRFILIMLGVSTAATVGLMTVGPCFFGLPGMTTRTTGPACCGCVRCRCRSRPSR